MGQSGFFPAPSNGLGAQMLRARTFTAVSGNGCDQSDPQRSKVSLMVARRSAWVLLPTHKNRYLPGRILEGGICAQIELARLAHALAKQLPLVRTPSRPTMMNKSARNCWPWRCPSRGSMSVVGIGRASPICARHMACADVAEVAAGHGEGDLLVVAVRGLQVAGKVVHDLGQQPRPVDRVDRADLVLRLEGVVVGDGLDDVPGKSSKPPSDGDVCGLFSSCRLNICACWKGLMRPWGLVIERRARPFLPAPAIRPHCVPAGATQDIQVPRCGGQFVPNMIAPAAAWAMVPEGQPWGRWTGFRCAARRQLTHRHDGVAAKLLGIGLAHRARRSFRRNVVDIERANLEGQAAYPW
ncbi:hypothetical protein FQR65_LT20543 [Abscondita terminalis]|nr:hypothetical protein FQR65_LT20543 [Abscondita terminalis]